jgi:hypothetical protein
MSLHHLAENLKKQGRGKDSELVHMTKGEVAGLHALARAHGGSLTTNPTTGLTEAGFLEDILPSIAGIGASMMGLGPLGIGLASGLTSYATNRDPNRALMSGLLSGGLSGLSQGIAGIGGDVLGSEVSAGAQSAADAARESILKGITPDMSISQEEALRNAAAQAAEEAGNAFGQPPSYADKMSAGWNQVTSSGKNAMDFLTANKYSALAAGLGLAGVMSPKPAGVPALTPQTGYAPRYTWNPQTRQYENAAPSPYTYYAAGGGEVPYPSGTASYPQSRIEGMAYSLPSANPVSANVVGALPKTDYDARITQQGDVFTAAAGAYVPKSKGASTDIYKETFDPESAKEDQDLMALIAKLSRNPGKDYAQGGIASLGEYAAGGKLLQGPGDGMSDSIPAVIKGQKPQRAALAQGEFVVPADVVSHLGNGSTDAGAKRLYSMMDKVRQARTGTKKQGRQINPEKFMPA